MITHHGWRPRLDHDLLLNPFAPITQRNSTVDHIELEETEEHEAALSEPAPEQKQDPTPAK